MNISVCIYSQHTLRGIVSIENKVGKPILEIELTDTTFKQLKYVVLEQKNFFDINLDTSHKVVHLLVSSLGCSPYIQRLDFRKNKTIFLAIELKDCSYELEEVLVKANRSFIRDSGDTSIFDVEGFRMKTDLTLGDILSRMPGIEIDVNKQILYQGKRVKQIWVQGRDILNNQHSLAIESLRAEDIETIEIVHEYKPFHLRFSQHHSSDVAMNIGLTKAAQNNLNGSAECLAGTNSKYQLGVEAFKVSGKSGESAFLRSNNTGKALIQPMEYLGLIPDFSSIGGGRSGELEVVPAVLLPDANAFKETQHLVSASIDHDFKKKINLKATMIGVYKNAREQGNVETVFFDENAEFTGQNNRNTKFPMSLGKFSMEYDGAENLSLSFNMSTRYSEQQSSNIRSGLYQQAGYFSMFTNQEYSWQYLPVVTVNLKHKSNWSSRHNAGVDIQNQSYDLAFMEDTSLVLPVYGQRLENAYHKIFFSSFLEKRGKIFFLEIKNNLEFGRFQTGVNFDELPSFENLPNYSYNWQNWLPHIQYGLKTDRWMAHLEVELAYNQLTLDNQAFKQTWLNPLFRVKHNWSLTNFIGLSLRQNKAFIDQQNTFGLYQLYDNLQIIHFDLEAGQISRTRLGSFYYFNSNRNKKSTISCTFNYQEKTNAISRFNRFESNFIISEIFLADKMKNSDFNFSFSKSLFRNKFQWRAKIKTMLASMTRNSLGNIDSRSLNFNTHFSSLWKGDWNAEWKGGYQLSKQTQGDIGQVWHRWKIGTSVSYQSKKISGNIDYDWRLNQIANTTVSLHILNFRLDYDLTTWCSLSLFGQDILNLNNSQALRFTTTPGFIEKVEYNRLLGSLMIGMKGSF